jgi:predicted acetyltransferase
VAVGTGGAIDRGVRPTPPWTLRPADRSDADAFFGTIESAFGNPVREEDRAVDLRVLEWDRTLVAVDPDHALNDGVVATAGIFSFSLTVPGAVVPAAGITVVSVAPTHRRRGLLTALMERQLADIAGREPLAVLWASEAPIYGRFGYGPAAYRFRATVGRDAGGVRPEAPAGASVAALPPDAAVPQLRQIYDATAAVRPGLTARDETWWQFRLHDPEYRHGGGSPLQCVVAHEGGRPTAYALYSVKPEFTRDVVPDGTVQVREALAVTPAGAAAMWRYLTGIDLVARVEVNNLPLDDPLPHLLVDGRRARFGFGESLWARIVDVAAALSARRYAAPVDLVVDVSDARRPANAGRYRLVGDVADARCARSDEEPDLSCDIAALGAAYLGGTPISALAAAGRVVEHRLGAVAEATVAFGWPVAAYCPMVF